MTGALTYLTQYSYDLADRLAQAAYPSGRTVTYTRDAVGRVTDVATDLGGVVALASGLTYEAFGGIDAMAYGNGVTLALGHDLDGRMAAMATLGFLPVPLSRL